MDESSSFLKELRVKTESEGGIHPSEAPNEVRSGGGRSKRIPSDCLPKTQVPAQLERGCIGADA